MVVWNTICADYYYGLEVGDVVHVSNFRVKETYVLLLLLLFQPLGEQVADVGSSQRGRKAHPKHRYEISVNTSNPPGIILSVKGRRS